MNITFNDHEKVLIIKEYDKSMRHIGLLNDILEIGDKENVTLNILTAEINHEYLIIVLNFCSLYEETPFFLPERRLSTVGGKDLVINNIVPKEHADFLSEHFSVYDIIRGRGTHEKFLDLVNIACYLKIKPLRVLLALYLSSIMAYFSNKPSILDGVVGDHEPDEQKWLGGNIRGNIPHTRSSPLDPLSS